MSTFNIDNAGTVHIHHQKQHNQYFKATPHSELARHDAINAYVQGCIGNLSQLILSDEYDEISDILHLTVLNLETVQDMIAGTSIVHR